MMTSVREIARRCYESLAYSNRKHYPMVYSQGDFFKDINIQKGGQDSVSVDLGCGTKPRNPFDAYKAIGIDINDTPGIIKADLVLGGIPLDDKSIDYVTAYEFIEHIPRFILKSNNASANPFICLMNEVYRVLKPGGLFLSQTPAFPSKSAFQDPTHVNIITEDTFPVYFASLKEDE